jgi:uncharacterized protein YjbI with pentapeptide repeats
MGADLSGACAGHAAFQLGNLTGALGLSADFSRADFHQTVLARARFCGADLTDATIRHSVLFEADLSSAVLAGTNLTGCDLRGAILREAELSMTVLSGAELAGADLTGAILSRTLLAGCRGLADARGLETCVHSRISSLDWATMREAIEKLPNDFLEGMGVAPREIESLRALCRA